MNMVEIFSLVLALISILVLQRLVQQRKQNALNRRIIRRLERTIEKLNSSNGKLWYRMMQTETPDFATEVTDVTSTKF